MPTKDFCEDDATNKNIINSAEKLVILLSSHAEFDDKMEALRDMNLLLEDCPAEKSTKNDPNIKTMVKQLPKFLFTAGDFEMQMSLIELMVRLVKKSERPLYARKWFPQQHLALKFLEIKDACFDADCRKFLNILNGSAGRRRSVYSYAAAKAYLGYHKLIVPKGGNVSEFWVDFNSVSKCLTIYVDEESSSKESMWETVTINADDVENYTIKEEGSYNLLHMNLTISVNELFDKCHDNSQVAQIVFDKSVDVTNALKVAFGNKSIKTNILSGKASIAEMDVQVNRAGNTSRGVKHQMKDPMCQMPDLKSPTTHLINSSKQQNKSSPKIVRGHDSIKKVSIPLNAMMSPAREMLPKATVKIPATKTPAKEDGQRKLDNRDLPKTPKSKQGNTKRVKTPLRIIIPNDKSGSDTANDKSGSDTDKEINASMKGTTKERKTNDRINVTDDDNTTPGRQRVEDDNTTPARQRVEDDHTTPARQRVEDDQGVREDVALDIDQDVTEDNGTVDIEAENNVAEEDFPVCSGHIVPMENDSDIIPDSLPIPPTYDSQLNKVDQSGVYTKKVYLAALTPTLSTVTEEGSRSKHTTPSTKLSQENVNRKEATYDNLDVSQESAVSSQSVKVLLTCSQTREKPRYNPDIGCKKQSKPHKQTNQTSKSKEKKDNDIEEVILENEEDPYDFQVEKRSRKSGNSLECIIEQTTGKSSPCELFQSSKEPKTQEKIPAEKEKSKRKGKRGKKGKKNKKNASNKAKKGNTEIDHYSFEEEPDTSQKEFNREQDQESLPDYNDDEPIPYEHYHRIKNKPKKNLEEITDEEKYREDSMNDFKEQSEEKIEKKKEVKKRKGQKRQFGEGSNRIKPVKGKQSKKCKTNEMEKENMNIERENKMQNTRSKRERKGIREIEVMRDACADGIGSEYRDRDLDQLHSMVMSHNTKQQHRCVGNILPENDDEEFLHGSTNRDKRKKNNGQQEDVNTMLEEKGTKRSLRKKTRQQNITNEDSHSEELDEINVEIDNSQDVGEGLDERRNKVTKENEKQKRKVKKYRRNENRSVNISKTKMNKKEDIEKFTWDREDQGAKKKRISKEIESSPEIIEVDTDIEVEQEEEESTGNEVVNAQDEEVSVASFAIICQDLMTGVKEKSKRSRKCVNYEERGSSVEDSSIDQSVKTVSSRKASKEVSNETRRGEPDDLNTYMRKNDTVSTVSRRSFDMISGTKDNDAISTVSRRSWLIEKEKKQVSTYSKGHTNVWVKQHGRASVYISPWTPDKEADRKRNKKGRASKTRAKKRLSSVENQFLQPNIVEDNIIEISEREDAKRRKIDERKDEFVYDKEERRIKKKTVAKKKEDELEYEKERRRTRKNVAKNIVDELEYEKEERRTRKNVAKNIEDELEYEKEERRTRKYVAKNMEDELEYEKEERRTRKNVAKNMEDELEYEKEERTRMNVVCETTPVLYKKRQDATPKEVRAPRKPPASQKSVSTEQDHLYFQECDEDEKTSHTSSGTSEKEFNLQLLNFHFDFEEDIMTTQKDDGDEDEDEDPDMTRTPAIPEKSPLSYKTPRLQRSTTELEGCPTDASGPSKGPRPTKSALKRKYQDEIEDEEDDEDVEDDVEEEDDEDVVVYEVMEKTSTRSSLRSSSLLIPKKLFEGEPAPDDDYEPEDQVDEEVNVYPFGVNITRGVATASSCSTDEEEIGQIEQLLHFVRGTINKQIQAKQDQTKILTGCAINAATKHVYSLWGNQRSSFKEFKTIQEKMLVEIVHLEDDLETMKHVEQKSNKLMKQLHDNMTLKLFENIKNMRSLLEDFQQKSAKLDGCLKNQMQNGFQNIISQEMNELKNRIIQDAKHQELMQMKKSLTSFFTSM